MALLSFERLYARSDEQAEAVPVVAAGGADPTVLQALHISQQRSWVLPIVTGIRAEIEAVAAAQSIPLDQFTVIDSDEPAAAAVAEVRAGRAALLMKGQIATPALMKAVLSRETGLRTGRTIGQVVLMEIVRDNRSFLMTDTGITIQPSFEQKRDLLASLVTIARQLRAIDSDDRPCVAVMAASEKATEAMPDTLEAAELQRLCEIGEISGCTVQGPLSFDWAYASDAGDKKRIAGSVVGAAEAMLFPSLQAANLTVKAIMYTADCRYGGVLVGTSAPVVFMSRADTVETRLNSLALTLQLLRSAATPDPSGN